MLFGGRPLPRLPLVLRIIIVLAVLSVGMPMIKPAVAALQEQFRKMSADDTERALAAHHLWGATPGPAREIRCEPGTGGWHYVCSYVHQAKVSPRRLKVGVHVGHRALTLVSPAHEIDSRSIRPY